MPPQSESLSGLNDFLRTEDITARGAIETALSWLQLL